MIFIGILFGYFIGMISCLWQVMAMEYKYNDKIKNIMENKRNK